MAEFASDDLRAAVAVGVLTQAQVVGLATMAASRRGHRNRLADENEPFEVSGGFSEILIGRA